MKIAYSRLPNNLVPPPGVEYVKELVSFSYEQKKLREVIRTLINSKDSEKILYTPDMPSLVAPTGVTNKPNAAMLIRLMWELISNGITVEFLNYPDKIEDNVWLYLNQYLSAIYTECKKRGGNKGGRKKINIDEKELTRLWKEKRHTIRSIAKILKVTHPTIRNRLKELCLK